MFKQFYLFGFLFFVALVNKSIAWDNNEETGEIASDDSKESEVPILLAKLINNQNSETGEAEFEEPNREKRRLTVFKNVYNRCRVQKRKDKDFCLYLANLYQSVKGFHGFK